MKKNFFFALALSTLLVACAQKRDSTPVGGGQSAAASSAEQQIIAEAATNRQNAEAVEAARLRALAVREEGARLQALAAQGGIPRGDFDQQMRAINERIAYERAEQARLELLARTAATQYRIAREQRAEAEAALAMREANMTVALPPVAAAPAPVAPASATAPAAAPGTIPTVEAPPSARVVTSPNPAPAVAPAAPRPRAARPAAPQSNPFNDTRAQRDGRNLAQTGTIRETAVVTPGGDLPPPPEELPGSARRASAPAPIAAPAASAPAAARPARAQAAPAARTARQGGGDNAHQHLRPLHELHVVCNAPYVTEGWFALVFGHSRGGMVITCRNGIGEEFTMLARLGRVDVGVGVAELREEGEMTFVGLGIRNRIPRGISVSVGAAAAANSSVDQAGRGQSGSIGFAAALPGFIGFVHSEGVTTGRGLRISLEIAAWSPDCSGESTLPRLESRGIDARGMMARSQNNGGYNPCPTTPSNPPVNPPPPVQPPGQGG